MGCKQSASIKPQTITIPGPYVIRRKVDGVWKEQYASVTSCSNDIYEFEYGIVGFHEGVCRYHNIRHLTEEEEELRKQKMYSSLPQQFYQSMPQ